LINKMLSLSGANRLTFRGETTRIRSFRCRYSCCLLSSYMMWPGIALGFALYAKKIIIHSFWSTLIIYLLVVYKKNNNSFFLVYFCQRSREKRFLQNLQKNTQEQQKGCFFTLLHSLFEIWLNLYYFSIWCVIH
jgi:hypothetical protein